MTNLEQALTAIAEQLNLDAAELIGYAREDYFTGWDNGTGQFPIGSLFGMEGQILYALVRATGATQVLELGTHVGASTAHIALAMHKRGVGRITTVDVQQGAGGMIPSDLLEHVTFVNTDAVAYLATVESNSVHILFEDLWHSSESCEAVGRAAKRVLAPGGLLIAHDAEHWAVGEGVRAGYDAAGIEYKTYLVPPSDCGLLIAQFPGTSYHEVTAESVMEHIADAGNAAGEWITGHQIDAIDKDLAKRAATKLTAKPKAKRRKVATK